MLAQGWVVAAQLKAAWVILAVFHRRIRMCALGAAQLDDDPIAFFGSHALVLTQLLSKYCCVL